MIVVECEFPRCLQHQNEKQDRLCVSTNCENQEKLICIYCSEEHLGRPTTIDSIQTNIKILSQKFKVKFEDSRENEAVIIKSLSEKLLEYQKRINSEIDRLIEDSIQQIQKAPIKLVEYLKQLEQINNKQLIQNQIYQDQFIKFEIQKHQLIENIENTIHNITHEVSEKFIKVYEDFQQFQIGDATDGLFYPSDQLEFIWEIEQFKSASNTRYHMAQLSQSEVVISNLSGQIKIVDTVNGQIKQCIETGTDMVQDCLVYIPEEFIAARNSNGQITIYNKNDLSVHQVIDLEERAGDQFSNSCLYVPSSKILISSIKNGQKNYGLVLFEFEEATKKFKLSPKQIKGNHDEKFHHMTAFNDFEILSASQDKSIIQWDLQNFISQKIIEDAEGIVCVKQIDDKRIIYNRWDGTVTLYDYVIGKQLRNFKTGSNQKPIDNSNAIFMIEPYNSNFVFLIKEFNKTTLQMLNIQSGEIRTIGEKANLEGAVFAIIINTVPKQILLRIRDGINKYQIR